MKLSVSTAVVLLCILVLLDVATAQQWGSRRRGRSGRQRGLWKSRRLPSSFGTRFCLVQNTTFVEGCNATCPSYTNCTSLSELRGRPNSNNNGNKICLPESCLVRNNTCPEGLVCRRTRGRSGFCVPQTCRVANGICPEGRVCRPIRTRSIFGFCLAEEEPAEDETICRPVIRRRTSRRGGRRG